MKYWKQITAFTLFAFFAQGQTHKVIKDTPDDIANYWVNIGVLDMGYAMKNPGYGFVGSSLNGLVHYKNKIGAEFTFRKIWLPGGEFANQLKPTQFEIGAYYNLFSKVKTGKSITVKMAKGRKAPTQKVDGSVQRSLGVRAGFNLTKQNLRIDTAAYKSDLPNGDYVMTSAGLYAGFILTSTANTKSYFENYGIKGGGFVRRVYVDLIFNPIRPVYQNDVNVGSANGVIGYRIGFQFLDPAPKKVFGNGYSWKFELGSRPIDGYYGQISMGYSFRRRVKPMSSFVIVREKE